MISGPGSKLMRRNVTRMFPDYKFRPSSSTASSQEPDHLMYGTSHIRQLWNKLRADSSCLKWSNLDATSWWNCQGYSNSFGNGLLISTIEKVQYTRVASQDTQHVGLTMKGLRPCIMFFKSSQEGPTLLVGISTAWREHESRLQRAVRGKHVSWCPR